MELGKECSGEESAEYFSYVKLLITRFSAQQVPVMKGNWSEKTWAGDSCRWGTAQLQGRWTFPTFFSLWHGSTTLPWPGLLCPGFPGAVVPGTSWRDSFLPLPWLLACQHLSVSGAKLCYFWGESRTNNSAHLPSPLPALPTDLCFAIDPEFLMELCCE